MGSIRPIAIAVIARPTDVRCWSSTAAWIGGAALPVIAAAVTRRTGMLGAVRVLLLVVVTATGCFTQTTAGVTFARGHVTGGAAEVTVGDLAARGTAELVAQQLAKDDGSTTFGVLYGGAVRVSIPGLIWKTEDWARWVDIGGDLGVGAGLSGTSGFLRAYAGGWMDIRLRPATEKYPTLRVQARRAAYTGDLSSETELMFGLGWTVNDTGWIPRGFE